MRLSDFLPRRQSQKIVHATDRLRFVDDDSTGSTRGNPYDSYQAQVKETSKKYEGLAEWGNQPVKNVIDVRAAFTIGAGVKAVAVEDRDEAQAELDFIKGFMERNGLDRQLAFDWASEAEIEGKILVRMDPAADGIDARFVSYTQHSYKITTDPDDYAKYISAEWKVNGTGKQVRLDSEKFCYAKFGGRTHKVNETPTKAGLSFASRNRWTKPCAIGGKSITYFPVLRRSSLAKMNNAPKIFMTDL